MRRSTLIHLIVAFGIVTSIGSLLYSADWFGLKPSEPAVTAPALLDNQDFYLYAQKQAELYRGELLTYSEMKRFGEQTKEDLRLWNIKQDTHRDIDYLLQELDTLEKTPYNLKANQQILNSLTHLGLQKKWLQIHAARLRSIADAYQEP